MAQRKQKSARAKNTLPPQLAAVNLHAAGIDSGAAAHWVAVPPRDDPQPVRGFGAYTADLEALADWLATCGIPTIALASTGVYWIPLFALLEPRGVAVLLVDPQQGQKITGRPQSDRHDCQWRQRLHTFGLLAGAFRPADQVCVLRSSLRQRAMLLTYAAQHLQPMQKARTQMHRKLQQVVSDMTGVTGLAIIRAILAGARDPEPRAPRRDSRCKHDAATIARALQGHWCEEPLFALAQALALYEFSHHQIHDCDTKIHAQLQTFAARSAGQPLPPAPRPRQQGRNPPAVAMSLGRASNSTGGRGLRRATDPRRDGGGAASRQPLSRLETRPGQQGSTGNRRHERRGTPGLPPQRMADDSRAAPEGNLQACPRARSLSAPAWGRDTDARDSHCP